MATIERAIPISIDRDNPNRPRCIVCDHSASWDLPATTTDHTQAPSDVQVYACERCMPGLLRNRISQADTTTQPSPVVPNMDCMLNDGISRFYVTHSESDPSRYDVVDRQSETMATGLSLPNAKWEQGYHTGYADATAAYLSAADRARQQAARR